MKLNYFWISLFAHTLVVLLVSLILSKHTSTGLDSKQFIPVYISKPSHQKTRPVALTHRLHSCPLPHQTHENKTSADSIRHPQQELSAQKAIDRPLLKMLHDAIAAHQTYPESALELNQKGTVTVSFLLHPDGNITQFAILHSSGFASLDDATYTAVMAISPFKNANIYLKNAEFLLLDIVFQ